MNKFLVVIFTFSFNLSFSQVNKSIEIFKELNLFYTDTINNNVYFGDYKPTGIIKTSDNSYLISTILSISFPELYETTYLRADYKKYFERWNLYYSKVHVSSGSILKLDRNLNKQWELIYKDKRITHIENLDSNSFIIAGERVDQKKLWVAKLRTSDGSTIWFKEYNVGYGLSTTEMSINNDTIYLLGETEILIPFRIQKQYGKRRIELFKVADLQSNLILLSISKNGNLIRKSKIDPKNKYTKFGLYFKVNSNEKILFTCFNGYYKKKNEWLKDKGSVLYRIDSKDRIKSKLRVEANDLLLSENDLVFSETKLKSDSITIKRLVDSKLVSVDSFSIQSERNNILIESLLKTDSLFYLFGSVSGDYLIYNMNKEYHITDYRKYERDESNYPVKLIETYDGNLMIVGWCYRKNEKTGNLYKYMNLVEIKKFGT
ncbi:MAG TPA: hypothetical protein VFG54_14900 [Prolixibacteraceae bacterium]|nr:hypothetical protein [Prolixibacteraceae bacterium]